MNKIEELIRKRITVARSSLAEVGGSDVTGLAYGGGRLDALVNILHEITEANKKKEEKA